MIIYYIWRCSLKLSEIELKEEYRTGHDDLVNSFYKPCLQDANLYDRSVGYFSSTVFLLIGPELIKFAQRGGKVRLVCSQYLSNTDIEALESGYQLAIDEQFVGKSLLSSVNLLIQNTSTIKNTVALATLIKCGCLEVKIAFRKLGNGLFHEKMGIIHAGNETVTFKGSVNETWSGWHERGNYETIDVFRSWVEGRDARQAYRNCEYFETLWDNDIDGLDVIPFPHVARSRLESISKESLADIDPDTLDDYFIPLNIDQVNKEVSKRAPLPHQVNAIEAWKEQGCRGVFEHATGSGKTFTALVALNEHLKNGGVALVLVPDCLLHKQWSEEIKSEIPDVILLKAGDGHDRWRKNRRLNTITQADDDLGVRVVLATMATARLPEFINAICAGPHLMIVVDEVHEIGSRENSNILTIDAGKRLGLSATPNRYGDPVGTGKIFNYFGDIVQPPFTLVDAINSGRLVKYEYLPEAIRFTVEESEQWELETKAISKEYARSKRDSNGTPIASVKLQLMLIQRSRIAKKASAKIPYAAKVINENYKEGESWLVYCEDQYQLGEVISALKYNGHSPCEYHTNMRGDAAASLEWFKQFGGIMVSIRCLDQGVDIPKISHAIILASSQNPRQFIQRRGRVLRMSPNKHKAVIYDAVMVPICLDGEPSQLSLLKSELQRSIQFSDTAMNKSGSNKLITIAIELGIDPQECGLYGTDGIEELGDVEDE